MSRGILLVAPTNPVTNSGTLEATNGGALILTGGPFNNTPTGLIEAAGGSSVVELNGSTIAGGTLRTLTGGTIQNSGIATLDGTTISTGSTVTLANGSTTILKGTITNNGTIAQSSTGSLTDIQLSGAVTLTGGGSLTMSNSFNNRVYGVAASNALTNDTNHTIQGAGQLGINNAGFAFDLTNKGTILANQAAELQIAPGGNISNNGTFQANSGSLLNVIGTLTNYNSGTSTLTGGTYKAFSGTIQLSQANAGGGSVIATNAATIVLDGATAKIADGSGKNILQGFFTTNTAAGSFTIQDGANLTTSASANFTNAGAMTIGPASTFSVGGSHNYVQTGGSTFLASSSSTLVAPLVNLQGGLLSGFGTIQGNLLNAGTVHPGDPPGILTVTGNYTQTSAGLLDIQIGGALPGSGFSQLAVGGTAALDGTLDLTLINGFQPFNGEEFVILSSTGLSGDFSTINGLHEGNVTFTVDYSPAGFPNDVVVTAHVSAVPEPASLVTLGIGLAGVGSFGVRRRLRKRRE